MKGRKPKPTEEKRLAGNPGKRPLGDPILIGERIVKDPDESAVERVEGEVIDAAVPPTVPVWMPAVPETVMLGDALALTAPEYVRQLGDLDVPGYGTVLDLYEQSIGRYAGARLWTEVVELLVDAGILARGDLFAVEEFVVATLEARRAMLELRAKGAIRESANAARAAAGGEVRAVAFRNWRDANTTMLRWAERLGLSPTDRARLGLAIGQGRKLVTELEGKLPANPVQRTGLPDEPGTDLDPYA